MVITRNNYDPKVAIEPVKGELLTEQGAALSVPEMLNRYAKGTLTGLSVRTPVYDDDDEPDPTQRPDFDLTDADLMLRDVHEKITRFHQSQQSQQPDPQQPLQQPQQQPQQQPLKTSP